MKADPYAEDGQEVQKVTGLSTWYTTGTRVLTALEAGT